MISTRLAVFLVCALAAGVYLNSLENGFAFDDEPVIESNEDVHGIERLRDAITGPYWPFGPPEVGMYRPLTLATYAVDWEIWDGRPVGFHLTNILLHALVTGLVLMLLVALGAGTGAAMAGAAVFAIHPVHVEAVANVVGRAELLAAAFYLGACLVYNRWQGWGSAAAVALLYLFGLFSKEIAATLPAGLLIIEWVRRGSVRMAIISAAARWPHYVLLVASLVVYFLVRAANIGAVLGASEPGWFYGLPPLTHLWTAIRVWPEYLRLMIVPLDLVPDYGPGVIVPEPNPIGFLVLLGAILGLVAAVVVWRAKRANRLLSAGIVWFAVTVLPVSGVLFAAGVILAERTLYLPSVGLALAVAGTAAWVQTYPMAWRRMGVLILGVLVVLGGLRTWRQNPVWKDSASILNYMVDAHPGSYRSHWGIGSYLLELGDTARALPHLHLASRMAPGYFSLRLEHGEALRGLGMWNRASREFEIARRLIPSSQPAHTYLIESLIETGELQRAVAASRIAADRFPSNEVIQHLAARAYVRAGDLHSAIGARRAAIDAGERNDVWVHWLNLAGLHLLDQDTASAQFAVDRARQVAPGSAEVPRLRELSESLEQEGPAASLPLW